MNLTITMPLDAATRIVDAALAAGRAEGMMPLTVAVLDAGGHLVALKREDGSGILRVEIAIGKAYAGLSMGFPTRLIRDRFEGRPNFVSGLTAAADGRFMAAPGGVLIRATEGAAVVGAVGISGDASDRDEFAAIAGVKAAGLSPDPAEPAENWREAGL